MTFEERKITVGRFLEAFNQGELEQFDELIAPQFFGYGPSPREERPTEIYRQIALTPCTPKGSSWLAR